MKPQLPDGVIFNAYPDSIGRKLADTVAMLKRPQFDRTFSLFYILPTIFNSGLDRGFSIIDYNLNEEMVSTGDLEELKALGIDLKLDLVLNHLSIDSPQFQDLLQRGDDSQYRDFFIDWNEFWCEHGEIGADGCVVPDKKYLDLLFIRKPSLPVLKVRFPDGTDRPYWNTFYHEVTYKELAPSDLKGIDGLGPEQARTLVSKINLAIADRTSLADMDWGEFEAFRDRVCGVMETKRRYLGQMDLNARSEMVWTFYDSTLMKLSQYGAKLVRLDAFAYLHKQPGMVNFFNKPGTWNYLDRLRDIAEKYGITLLPEIHFEYGKGLHNELAAQGFPIYDFFLPGLVIHTIDCGSNRHLLSWARELIDKGIRTINMLGCHDGIPILDLRGSNIDGNAREGLLSDEEINATLQRIINRGGRVKNLYSPTGEKISYYQVNATFFSALDEDERKLLLARAIQLFMPGTPQIWYLDLFAGKNDYEAADKASTAGHKEINRTNLTLSDIEQGLKRIVVQDQLQLIRLRNTWPAFNGDLEIGDTDEHHLLLTWRNGNCTVTLQADLLNYGFTIMRQDESSDEYMMSYR